MLVSGKGKDDSVNSKHEYRDHEESSSKSVVERDPRLDDLVDRPRREVTAKPSSRARLDLVWPLVNFVDAKTTSVSCACPVAPGPSAMSSTPRIACRIFHASARAPWCHRRIANLNRTHHDLDERVCDEVEAKELVDEPVESPQWAGRAPQTT